MCPKPLGPWIVTAGHVTSQSLVSMVPQEEWQQTAGAAKRSPKEATAPLKAHIHTSRQSGGEAQHFGLQKEVIKQSKHN